MNNPLEEYLDELVSQLNETSQNQYCDFGALCLLLMEKGVFTPEEYARARVQAQQVFDQVAAQKRDEAQGEPE